MERSCNECGNLKSGCTCSSVPDENSSNLTPAGIAYLRQLGGMADGGERKSYSDGAQREVDPNRPRPELASPFAYMRLGRWYALGAQKYADRNWEKGMSFSDCTASMERHLQKWKMGMTDEDHLAAIAWNAFAIMHYQELGMTQFDDMPKYNIPGA